MCISFSKLCTHFIKRQLLSLGPLALICVSVCRNLKKFAIRVFVAFFSENSFCVNICTHTPTRARARNRTHTHTQKPALYNAKLSREYGKPTPILTLFYVYVSLIQRHQQMNNRKTTGIQ